MTTEHFVLQSAAAATTAEASSRATLFLTALSGSLVTLGLTAQDPQVFPFVASAIVPAVFLLGLFTIVRLVDTTIDNLGYQARMRRVYEYYATLAPNGQHNFPIGPMVQNEAQTTFRIHHRYPLLTTTTTAIGAVDSLVGGAAVAYTLAVQAHAIVSAAVAAGAAFAFLTFTGTVAYQRNRFTAANAVPEAIADAT